MTKKHIKPPSGYLTEVKALSDWIVKAQQPIRILDAIKWDDSIKQEFFKGKLQKATRCDTGILSTAPFGL